MLTACFGHTTLYGPAVCHPTAKKFSMSHCHSRVITTDKFAQCIHRSSVLSDCVHRSSQWSTPHWIHCEFHLPHTPTTTWGGSDISMERSLSIHISSCCKLQPSTCHSHHKDKTPSHSNILLSGVLQESAAYLGRYCHHCTR